uniref:Uncharacterized protein n=1 Tax=Romanomermis culicivorax TaxID=13658 RepID=A0A915ISK6_ROMCU
MPLRPGSYFCSPSNEQKYEPGFREILGTELASSIPLSKHHETFALQCVPFRLIMKQFYSRLTLKQLNTDDGTQCFKDEVSDESHFVVTSRFFGIIWIHATNFITGFI